MTSKLIGIATAATIAIAALASTASAAPLAAFGNTPSAAFGNTGQQSQAAGDFVVKIGHRSHRHGHGHGHRWHKRFGFYDYYLVYDYPGYSCWTKKKIFTRHGFFWKKIWICG
ncbi:hypothetical protein [Mesorhizobium sp.]|uniref:hypothetical protein n=1 Tax=Mesorhizobium sp. TaxID=1871066 RepID=UPI000FE7CB60|nr:hypothetical protein [Mesorhizobium sp.]RWP39590.1 MAG: hypothetical protein EOR04_22375 [Mesorhizobium sp.]RWP61381.1 MAG: hypothetical protein EOR08_17860 [Mesorhizobium sp.]